MQIPLSIATHHTDLPASATSLIRKKAHKLERFYERLTGCEVIVEGPGGHHMNGGPYGVNIHLSVPGSEIHVDRQSGEDLMEAIREAFEAARRQLKEYARKQRGEVKAKEAQPRGRVMRIFRERGYGFLETADGREVYFHENSVLEPGFGTLEVGTEVRYTEEQGFEGPQASSLAPAG